MARMQLTVAPASASRIVVSKTNTTVVVQKQPTATVEIAALGPQGPSFTGANYFDTTAIGALTSGDTGTLLQWGGAAFVPTNELSQNLTIAGGAF